MFKRALSRHREQTEKNLTELVYKDKKMHHLGSAPPAPLESEMETNLPTCNSLSPVSLNLPTTQITLCLIYFHNQTLLTNYFHVAIFFPMEIQCFKYIADGVILFIYLSLLIFFSNWYSHCCSFTMYNCKKALPI